MRSRFNIVAAIIVVSSAFAPIVPGMAAEATVTLLSPIAGQTIVGRSVEIAIGYNTGSTQNVTHVEMYLDDKRLDVRQLDDPKARGIISFVLDSTKVDNGPHSISAKVFAGSKLIGSVSGAVKTENSAFDETPPTIQFDALNEDSVLRGTQQILLNVKEDGDTPPVVSILVDKTIKGIRNKPPYEFALNTEELTDGTYEIEAIAVDGAGNQAATPPVRVTIENAAKTLTVAAIPVEPSQRSEEDDVVMMDSSIVQVLADNVVTTLDPETGVPVTEEPVVPVASMPSLLALSARSTLFDVLPLLAAACPPASGAANTAVQPDAAAPAPAETSSLLNDVSVVDSTVPRKEAAKTPAAEAESMVAVEEPVAQAELPAVADAAIVEPSPPMIVGTSAMEPESLVVTATVAALLQEPEIVETPQPGEADTSVAYVTTPIEIEVAEPVFAIETPAVESPTVADAVVVEPSPPIVAEAVLAEPWFSAAAETLTAQALIPEVTETPAEVVEPSLEAEASVETVSLGENESAVTETEPVVAVETIVAEEDMQSPPTEAIAVESETPAVMAQVEPPSVIAPRVENPVLPVTLRSDAPDRSSHAVPAVSVPREEPQAVASAVEIKEINSVGPLPLRAPRDMVVLREILQSVGLKVSWLANGGVVAATDATNNIEFQIGASEVLINNRIVILSRSIESVNGQVMGPVSLLKELGLTDLQTSVAKQ